MQRRTDYTYWALAKNKGVVIYGRYPYSPLRPSKYKPHKSNSPAWTDNPKKRARDIPIADNLYNPHRKRQSGSDISTFFVHLWVQEAPARRRVFWSSAASEAPPPPRQEAHAHTPIPLPMGIQQLGQVASCSAMRGRLPGLRAPTWSHSSPHDAMASRVLSMAAAASIILATASSSSWVLSFQI